MGVETKIFKSGNSLAVRLPKHFGFTEGMAVSVEANGQSVTINSVTDPVEEKRKLTAWIESLRALGPPILPVEVRDPDIFPDRPGLY